MLRFGLDLDAIRSPNSHRSPVSKTGDIILPKSILKKRIGSSTDSASAISAEPSTIADSTPTSAQDDLEASDDSDSSIVIHEEEQKLHDEEEVSRNGGVGALPASALHLDLSQIRSSDEDHSVDANANGEPKLRAHALKPRVAAVHAHQLRAYRKATGSCFLNPIMGENPSAFVMTTIEAMYFTGNTLCSQRMMMRYTGRPAPQPLLHPWPLPLKSSLSSEDWDLDDLDEEFDEALDVGDPQEGTNAAGSPSPTSMTTNTTTTHSPYRLGGPISPRRNSSNSNSHSNNYGHRPQMLPPSPTTSSDHIDQLQHHSGSVSSPGALSPRSSSGGNSNGIAKGSPTSPTGSAKHKHFLQLPHHQSHHHHHHHQQQQQPQQQQSKGQTSGEMEHEANNNKLSSSSTTTGSPLKSSGDVSKQRSSGLPTTGLLSGIISKIRRNAAGTPSPPTTTAATGANAATNAALAHSISTPTSPSHYAAAVGGSPTHHQPHHQQQHTPSHLPSTSSPSPSTPGSPPQLNHSQLQQQQQQQQGSLTNSQESMLAVVRKKFRPWDKLRRLRTSDNNIPPPEDARIHPIEEEPDAHSRMAGVSTAADGSLPIGNSIVNSDKSPHGVPPLGKLTRRDHARNRLSTAMECEAIRGPYFQRLNMHSSQMTRIADNMQYLHGSAKDDLAEVNKSLERLSSGYEGLDVRFRKMSRQMEDTKQRSQSSNALMNDNINKTLNTIHYLNLKQKTKPPMRALLAILGWLVLLLGTLIWLFTATYRAILRAFKHIRRFYTSDSNKSQQQSHHPTRRQGSAASEHARRATAARDSVASSSSSYMSNSAPMVHLSNFSLGSSLSDVAGIGPTAVNFSPNNNNSNSNASTVASSSDSVVRHGSGSTDSFRDVLRKSQSSSPSSLRSNHSMDDSHVGSINKGEQASNGGSGGGLPETEFDEEHGPSGIITPPPTPADRMSSSPVHLDAHQLQTIEDMSKSIKAMRQQELAAKKKAAADRARKQH